MALLAGVERPAPTTAAGPAAVAPHWPSPPALRPLRTPVNTVPISVTVSPKTASTRRQRFAAGLEQAPTDDGVACTRSVAPALQPSLRIPAIRRIAAEATLLNSDAKFASR